METLSKRFLRTLLITLSLLLGLRLIYWFASFPNADEGYYWLWGRYPGLSYFDHPPLLAWLQGISHMLFGDSRFALRFFNLMTSIGLMGVYYAYLKRLLDERAARAAGFITLALLFASPVMFSFLATAWPDHIMLFTSALAVYLFLRFFDSYLETGRGKTHLLFLGGIALGLAAISKYNSVFVALGIIATLIQDPRLRRLWLDPRLYATAVIVILVMSPVLYWNIEHQLGSFKYHFLDQTNLGKTDSYSATRPLSFIFSLALSLSPFIVWLLFSLLRRKSQLQTVINGRDYYLNLPLWIFMISSVSFIILSLSDNMLYYWNIVAYVFIFPVLALFILTTRAQRRTVYGHLGYGVLAAGFIVFHSVYNPIPAYFDTHSDQDSRMMYGWDQVTPRVLEKQRQLEGQYGEALIIGTDYRKASALAFMTGKKNIYCLDKRTDQFKYWQHNIQFQGKAALIVSDDWHPINAYLHNTYSTIKQLETITVYHHGLFIKHYYLSLAYNKNWNPLIHNRD